MTMAKERPDRSVDDTTWAAATADARRGASVHMIALTHKLSLEEASEILDSLASETKSAAPAHRVALRQMLRDQVPAAIGVLREVAQGSRPGPNGTREALLDSKEKREVAGARLRAADMLLRHASRFLDEDVVRGWFERPEDPKGVQPTVFDFGAELDAEGATRQYVRPQLSIVLGGGDLEALEG